MSIRHISTTIALLAAFVLAPLAQASDVTPAEARAIAKDAYICGYPLVDNYLLATGNGFFELGRASGSMPGDVASFS